MFSGQELAAAQEKNFASVRALFVDLVEGSTERRKTTKGGEGTTSARLDRDSRDASLPKQSCFHSSQRQDQ